MRCRRFSNKKKMPALPRSNHCIHFASLYFLLLAMCDFDIASFRNQSVKCLKKKKPKSKAKAKEEDRDAKENGANEFALRLQKRKVATQKRFA